MMASDETRKNVGGTIFMGAREATPEQLNAMQEPVRREKMRREQAEDYMERMRKRAMDRAREILGEAYAERLKVLGEAKVEADAARRAAARESQKLKGESESLKKAAADELDRARHIREEAEKMREGALEEGRREGMEQAAEELRAIKAELGRSVARVIQALGSQRQGLADAWRDDLCELTRAAAAAGAGFLLQKEHKAILNTLVIQALQQLETRSTITVRVNPDDEATVADMFQAARECVPDLRQWIVTPDDSIEPGGFVAENGAGRVDCRRENFREMVGNILAHLTLPILESEEESEKLMRDLVDEEAARLAAYAAQDAPQAEPARKAIEPEEASAAGRPVETDQQDTAGAANEIPSRDANPEQLDAVINELLGGGGEAPLPEELAEEAGPREPAEDKARAAGTVAEEKLAAEDAPAAGASLAGEALVGYQPVQIDDELDDGEFFDAPEGADSLPPETEEEQPTLAELEDELFPLEGDGGDEKANQGDKAKE